MDLYKKRQSFGNLNNKLNCFGRKRKRGSFVEGQPLKSITILDVDDEENNQNDLTNGYESKKTHSRSYLDNIKNSADLDLEPIEKNSKLDQNDFKLPKIERRHIKFASNDFDDGQNQHQNRF